MLPIPFRYLLELDSCFQYNDSEARTLWGKLMPKVPDFFKGLEVKPSLVHGDLWGGNAAELDDRPSELMRSINQIYTTFQEKKRLLQSRQPLG